MPISRDNAEPDSTENWDDDFEFQQDGSTHTRRSTAGTQRHDTLESSKDVPLSKDRSNTLTHWAEPGPSTPTKRSQAPTENWDDDFQDKGDSPKRNTSPRSRRSHVRPSMENWDDEFESRIDSPRKSARWSSSSSDEGEFGFTDKEEDRTVTSRSKRAHVYPGDTPPPPVPPIPSFQSDQPAPFPRSPTISVFSVPNSESATYSSTAHLALRPTRSGSSFGVLPPSPPVHRERERRRLRKKSRPPRVDDNIYELDDRTEPCTRPLTPPREQTPPSSFPPTTEAPVVEASTSTRASLVSRIGSVGKKFGAARRKRVSTEPSEVALQESAKETPSSSSPHSTHSRWFFRHGGGGTGSPPGPSTPLKHETSADKLLKSVVDPQTPSRRKQRPSDLPEDLSEMVQHQNGHGQEDSGSTMIFGTPRRPISMHASSVPQEPRSARPSSSRHTSYQHNRPRSRSSSKHRSASASVDDLARTRIDEEVRGSRRFMGGMRRISITGKHKRTKSTVPSVADSSSTVERKSGERTRPRVSTSSSNAPAVPFLPTPITALVHENESTPRPTTRTRPSTDQTRPNVEGLLLPPIELQPPSPQHLGTSPIQTSQSEPISSLRGVDSLLQSHEASPVASAVRHKPSASPQQSASLGRSTHPPKDEGSNVTMPRRNSLGDLKIPARISQAQSGLRRDLVMVRDFATSVEQLRQLQNTYNSLVTEVQTLLVSTAPPDPPTTRALAPTLFNIPRPGSRGRSNTNPQASTQAENHQKLSSGFNSIHSKYRISWECAELLIELGGGPPAPSGTASPPQPSSEVNTPRASRDRAITLGGDEPRPDIILPPPASSTSTPSTNGHASPMASPPNSAWRASTGRSDLSDRQLYLLRNMITQDAPMQHHEIPEEEVNRNWKWGNAMSSAVTLPSEESSQPASTTDRSSSPMKKRRSHFGMRGLRDMLRSLKKSQQHLPPSSSHSPHTPPPMSVPHSSTSFAASTDSSINLPSIGHGNSYRPQSLIQRRRAKTSTGPESMKSLRERDYQHPNSPYATTGPASLSQKTSPRRPSLASIFRLGQKHKSSSTSSNLADNSSTNSTNASPHGDSNRKELQLSVENVVPSNSEHDSRLAPEESEDWDQMESTSDLEHASRALFGPGADPSSTVRGRKGKSPYAVLQQNRRTPNASQSSIWGGGESPQKPSAALNPTLSPMSTQSPSSRRPSSSSGKSKGNGVPSPSPRRPPSRNKRQTGGLSGSVRSAPPQTWLSQGHGYSPELQGNTLPIVPSQEGMSISLAMTPENIKPLLENAKEVYVRCSECIAELHELLAASQSIVPQ